MLHPRRLLCHPSARPLRLPSNARNFQFHTSPYPERSTVTLRDLPATPPLSLLPLPNLLRSFALTAVSSYPLILVPSLKLLARIANSPYSFLSPDRNPLLHYLLKKTFYAQYCGGETMDEVCSTIMKLKEIGFKGVILANGKEIVLAKGAKLELSIADSTFAKMEQDVHAWKQGIVQSINMAGAGDFVALKFSGAGQDVMRQLAAAGPCGQTIELATTEICNLARKRGVRLLFDAEQDAVQRGIDRWTLEFQGRYNKETALVYGTYQAYLRATASVLAHHLAIASRCGFTLGVKLVRGAYMQSDPQHLFWSTKRETDLNFDGIAEALIKREWNSVLQPIDLTDRVPSIDLVLASHNSASVKKAMDLRQGQSRLGATDINVAYAQLMGMADEVSCELVLAGRENKTSTENKGIDGGYKYLVWGSVGECLKYLVRRAEENRDAVLRARDSRIALKGELLRRIMGRRQGDGHQLRARISG